jgi:hypothetical protein
MPTVAQGKAFLKTELGKELPCTFNPSELQVSRENLWAADSVVGAGVPRLRFAGAQSGVLRVSLLFDTTDDASDVRKHTGELVGLMDPNPQLPGSDAASGNVRPQWVTFNWGDLHSFKGVVSALDLSFVYFTKDGVPLRARADIVLTQFEPDRAFGPQNPTSGTPQPHKVHRVSPNETLDRIAAQHYGDPTRWRDIAAANGIEDPQALSPGTLLSIPRLEQ